MQLHEMRRYAAIHGTPFVPVRWEDPTGDFNNSLAKWVHAQPTLYSQRRLAIRQVPNPSEVGMRGWGLSSSPCSA